MLLTDKRFEVLVSVAWGFWFVSCGAGTSMRMMPFSGFVPLLLLQGTGSCKGTGTRQAQQKMAASW